MSLARAISLIDDRVYTGPAQVLSDPTDLLHRWAASAPSRNSPLLTATLRRTSDGVEADFTCDARGYLPRAEVLAWAGASAVTVARLWGSAGTQLGPELVVDGGFDNPASWPTVVGWSVANGKLNAAAAATQFVQGIVYEEGKLFRCSVNATVVSGAARFRIRGTVANNINATGAHVSYVVGGVTNSIGFAVITEFTGTLDNFSVREILTTNAVQTTTANQPPLDLTVSPLRIGAAASTSLVATLPAAINGARVLTADENGVAVATANLDSGAYNVQSANALRERVVLAADTPEADVEAVKRNMMRAWRLGAAA